MARIITFIIFGSFGVVLFFVGITQFVQQRRNMTNAERVDAAIVSSELFTSTSRDTDARVRAYVNPSHLQQAFLIASAGSGPIVFIILGLLLPPIAWFVGKYV